MEINLFNFSLHNPTPSMCDALLMSSLLDIGSSNIIGTLDILATAAYAKKKNIDCLAIVRGEEYFELNPLLTLAKEYGMKFCFVSRNEYAKRNDNKNNKEQHQITKNNNSSF